MLGHINKLKINIYKIIFLLTDQNSFPKICRVLQQIPNLTRHSPTEDKDTNIVTTYIVVAQTITESLIVKPIYNTKFDIAKVNFFSFHPIYRLLVLLTPPSEARRGYTKS